MVSGYSLSALGKPLIAPAQTWPLVLLARSVDRLGKGVRTGARDAYIADSVDAKGRAQGLGPLSCELRTCTAATQSSPSVPGESCVTTNAEEAVDSAERGRHTSQRNGELAASLRICRERMSPCRMSGGIGLLPLTQHHKGFGTIQLPKENGWSGRQLESSDAPR